MILKAFDGEVEAVSVKRYGVSSDEDQVIMSIVYRQKIYNWTLGNCKLSSYLGDTHYLFALLRQKNLTVQDGWF